MTDNPEYRPGRIQTISPDQEVVLKQVWAHLLKYWGYGVALSDSDCSHVKNFIASSASSRENLAPLSKSLSRRLTTSHHAPKSSSWFRKSSSHHQHEHHHHVEPKSPVSSRAPLIRKTQSRPDASAHHHHYARTRRSPAQETYIPVKDPSEKIREIFEDYVGQLFGSPPESSAEYIGTTSRDGSASMASETYLADSNDHDGSDIDSFSSFVTAHTTFGCTLDSLPQPEPLSPSPSNSPKPKLKTSTFRFMAAGDPETSHRSWVGTMRQDMIDNYVLRFCRARKFAYQEVLEMFHKSLIWRSTASFPNDWLNMGDAPSFLAKKQPKYYNNYVTGKSYFGGRDRAGNPLLCSQTRKHFASELTPEFTNKFSLVCIEWTRLAMREVNESADQTSVIFDLTDFSLKNSDNNSIKFLAETLEAYYPECLAAVYIFNAPWIFSTVWNIIKRFLDPVVASKIRFIKGVEELTQYIDMDNIPKALGGNSPVTDVYPEPSEDDARPKEKDERYYQLARERESLLLRFIETTQRWIEATNAQVSAKYLSDKIELDTALSYNYIELDPYIRCRGVPDRDGSLTLKN